MSAPRFIDLVSRLQFFHFMCSDDKIELDDDVALELAQMPDVDEACRAGTSTEDLDAEDYLTLISNTVDLLGGNFTIPEDEIDQVCEVRFTYN